MSVELRWVVPEGTTTERPRLQYRECGQWPSAWSEWLDVPTVAVPAEPKPIMNVAAILDAAANGPNEASCAMCNGRGFYGIPGQRCRFCDGSGKVKWRSSPPPPTGEPRNEQEDQRG